jgi:hypothetical protein
VIGTAMFVAALAVVIGAQVVAALRRRAASRP